MILSKDDLVVARVLSEDEQFMTVELSKDNEQRFTLDPDEPDRYYIMVFIKMKDEDGPKIWKPWEEGSGDSNYT